MSKNQINLPKTAFSMKANLPIREPEILKLWKKIDLYKELREFKKRRGKICSPRWSPICEWKYTYGYCVK